MKFTTPAGDLLDCLRSVHGRAKSNTIEILKHIRFDVEGPQLTMTGHDMSASCEAYLGVDDPTDGSCAVPGQAIVQLIGSLPKSSHVVIELDGLQVTIKSGRSRYKLPILRADDFPAALACEEGCSVQLSGDDVATLFGRSRQALDPRDARPFGQGIYLHMADGHLCASGISLFHFARLQVDAKMPPLAGVIVPLAAVDEIAKLGKAGCYLSVSGRTIAVEANGRRFCSKLIEEKYPDYARLLPPVGSTYVDIDRLETLEAVRRLTSIAATNSVIDLMVGDGEIVLTLSGLGEGVETVQCSSEEKISGHVSIVAERFIEMMEIPRGEVLQLHFTKRSMLMRVVDPTDAALILVESTRIPHNYRAAA